MKGLNPFDVKMPRVDLSVDGRVFHRCAAQAIPDLWCRFGIFPEVPEVIYRYLKADHAEELLGQGRMRLGTLVGYRSADQLNLAQADPFEGTTMSSGKLAGIVFPGMVYTERVRSVNSWILCLSTMKSKELMEGFEADTVLEIETRPFALELARSMAIRSEIGSVRNVDYIPYGFQREGEKRRLAMFTKSPNFAWQSEVRFSFERRGDFEKAFRHRVKREQLSGKFWIDGSDDGTSVSEPIWTKSPAVEDLHPIFVVSASLRKFAKDVTKTVID